jgi:transposase
MRGTVDPQIQLTMVTPEQLVPADHPIRSIKPIVDAALGELDAIFDAMYSDVGRPSIPPEHLLKACLLMAFYSIRSERQFCERMQYDILFKWFLDLDIDDLAWDQSTFAKNRERLLENEISAHFFAAIRHEAKRRHLLSRDHFTVDGTLLEAKASLKSLALRPNLGGQRKKKKCGPGGRPGGGQPGGGGGGRNLEVNWRGERRSNQTHFSSTDPEARLATKSPGQAAKLSFAGHVLMENRHGLVVDVDLTEANGRAERESAMRMLHRLRRRRGRGTVAGDKGFDTAEFVSGVRELGFIPHIAQNISAFRGSNIPYRIAETAAYEVSQRFRKRIEEIFGWWKTVGGVRKLRYVGVRRNRFWIEMTSSAYNLVRMGNLAAATA